MIFERASAMLGRGLRADAIMLEEDLRSAGLLEECGGPAKLRALVDMANRAGAVNGAIKLVKNKAAVRRLMEQLEESKWEAHQANATDEVEVDRMVAEAQERLSKLEQVGTVGARPLQKIKDEVLHNWTRRQVGDATGVPSGFSLIDRVDVGNGFQDEEMYLAMGITGCGKTAFMLNCAYTQAMEHGKSVYIFSLEMSAAALVDRLVALHLTRTRMGSVPTVADIRAGITDPEADAVVMEGLRELSEARIFIDDEWSTTVEQMRSRLRRHQRKHGVDVVYIDFLQKIPGDRNNWANDLTRIGYSLKDMAREFGLPVVVMAQVLEKAVEARGGSLRMTDLKDSGGPIQASAMVIGLQVPFQKRKRQGINNFGQPFEEHYYEKQSGVITMEVLKNRHGREDVPGERYDFQGAWCNFVLNSEGWR
jgi:replicative DNA helicase